MKINQPPLTTVSIAPTRGAYTNFLFGDEPAANDQVSIAPTRGAYTNVDIARDLGIKKARSP